MTTVIPNGFVTPEEASKLLSVHTSTLRKWANDGKIQFTRVDKAGAHRYYNVKEFVKQSNPDKFNDRKKRKICYCRVSTRNQKDDLERQEQWLRERYPDYEYIKDIGSGLNFKRPGLKTVVEYAIRGEIEELVVAYRDRLARFGYDLLEHLIEKYSCGKIVVLNNRQSSPQEELTDDLLSIITVFSARSNGLRKYRQSIKDEFNGSKNDSQDPKDTNIPELPSETVV